MNTTLNQLLFELLELRRALVKDTDPVDKRIVIDWILSQRARLLEQKFKKPFASIDDNYVQALGPIGMEKVLSNELVPVVNDFTYMYRTTVDIPKTIERPDGKGTFTRVGPADRLSTKFTVLTYDQALYFGNGKFNKNEICAFVLGDRLYLNSKSGVHYGVNSIDVRGVFQDPINAALIKDPTWTYNDNFPINKEMIDQMKELIVQSKFALTLSQSTDKVDDRSDNPEGQSIVQKNLPNIQQQ